uniref:tetraspanin-8-like isoform X1 n=1 Tax=Doryrhamphus excisus TaxID=161450 RepID=UPI0025ADAF9B|nr:tetraspanin-8-like isoform X1 [Doryrhamphus excisus]
MTQVNRCLKLTFIVSNVFFALEGRGTALVMLYVVGTITMVIAAVGAYGAHRQSRPALIVFLVCMVIGSLLMLRVGIPAAAVRPQLEGLMRERLSQLLPLDATSQENKDVANSVQEMLKCCGLFSYEDWRQNIPDSCSCDDVAEMEGKCQSVNYLMLLQRSRLVFSQPCFPLIAHYVLMAVDVVIGVVFVLAILALLGLTLSSIIIHQLRAANRPSVVMVVPSIFKAAPPKYQELHNPPMY